MCSFEKIECLVKFSKIKIQFKGSCCVQMEGNKLHRKWFAPLIGLLLLLPALRVLEGGIRLPPASCPAPQEELAAVGDCAVPGLLLQRQRRRGAPASALSTSRHPHTGGTRAPCCTPGARVARELLLPHRPTKDRYRWCCAQKKGIEHS